MSKTLSKLMLTGIATGTLLAHLAQAADGESKKSNGPKSLMELAKENDGNVNYELMTEDDLLLQLNSEGTKIYNSLSPEGKKMAIHVASAACNGTNLCKGLNACATDTNKCAGQGQCKGQGKCSFSDKNLAVKLVAKKMAEKRTEAQKGSK